MMPNKHRAHGHRWVCARTENGWRGSVARGSNLENDSAVRPTAPATTLRAKPILARMLRLLPLGALPMAGEAFCGSLGGGSGTGGCKVT